MREEAEEARIFPFPSGRRIQGFPHEQTGVPMYAGVVEEVEGREDSQEVEGGGRDGSRGAKSGR
jgi:hypothetical protein